MSDFVSLNHCEYGLESIESQISDFRRKRGCRNDIELLDQISANQLTWMERKEIKKKKCLSLEDGLAYTSFPVQQRWNLKCYCIDINSYKQHYIHSV